MDAHDEKLEKFKHAKTLSASRTKYEVRRLARLHVFMAHRVPIAMETNAQDGYTTLIRTKQATLLCVKIA